MIVVQISGGLGNQLFQYAMGRSLALKNNCELKLDLSFFKNYEWHEYSLEPFNIIKNIISKEEIEKMKLDEKAIARRINKKLTNAKTGFIAERSLAFNPAYLKIKSPAYLIGYWQCVKYFIEHAEIIRKDFQINIAPSKANQAILNKITSTDAVSLHIRRGNFVNDDTVNKVHGTCTMEYYQSAINLVSKSCNNPTFYIFSNDIPWAKQNLKINFDHVFVDVNDDKTDYEDLRLMSNCKYHILANSTFSWWGAWLSKHKNKLVTAPKIWFADVQKNREIRSLMLDEWHLI